MSILSNNNVCELRSKNKTTPSSIHRPQLWQEAHSLLLPDWHHLVKVVKGDNFYGSFFLSFYNLQHNRDILMCTGSLPRSIQGDSPRYQHRNPPHVSLALPRSCYITGNSVAFIPALAASVRVT